MSEVLKIAKGAKNPFQFVALFMHLSRRAQSHIYYINLPISMDASSSAYQIMSYFILNKELAISTNLIKARRFDEEVNDLYKDILGDAMPYM